MKPVALLTLLMFATPNAPDLTARGFSGFPAIAKNGKTLALVDTEQVEGYANDRFESGTLRFIATANAKEVKAVELQFLKQDDLELEDPFIARLAAAQAQLKKDEYSTLPKLEAASTDAGLTVDYQPPVLTFSAGPKQVLTAKLPIIKATDLVCQSDESITDKKSCEHERRAQLESVWVDEPHRTLVVQYGYYEGRDGTEKGPDFMVLKY